MIVRRTSFLATLTLALLGACIPDGNVGRVEPDAQASDDATARLDSTGPMNDSSVPDASLADVSGDRTPDAAPPSTSFGAAVRACALYEACIGGILGSGVTACAPMVEADRNAREYAAMAQGLVLFVTDSGYDEAYDYGLAQSEPAMRACLLAATTCTDVERCMNGGTAATACSDTPSARCDGTVARACAYPSSRTKFASSTSSGTSFAPRTIAFDCAATGQACVPAGSAGGQVACANAVCNPGTYVPGCEGNAPHNCGPDLQGTSGIESVGAPCRSGTTCQVSGTGPGARAACVGNGAVCDPGTFNGRCVDANTIVSCTALREETRTCPGSSLCAVGTDGRATCAYPRGTDCSGADGATCDTASGVLSWCVNGHAARVDCRANGHRGCGVQSGSTEPSCL